MSEDLMVAILCVIIVVSRVAASTRVLEYYSSSKLLE